MKPSRAVAHIALTLAALACVVAPRLRAAAQPRVAAVPVLHDLTSIGQLQTAFDADRDQTRVLLLLSPT